MYSATTISRYYGEASDADCITVWDAGLTLVSKPGL